MALIDMFYPKICVGCSREGSYICQACQGELVRPGSICPTCSRSSPGGWVRKECGSRCGLDRLLVGLEYRGMVQRCLKKVKYKSSWEIIDFLFHLCQFELKEGLLVPVPMYGQKERERGFNQSERIAHLLSVQTGLHCLPLLKRVRDTLPMYGLSKARRQENVAGAFTLSKVQTPLPRRAILVDDVWTTGATMRACASVLKKAGIAEVWGVALAR